MHIILLSLSCDLHCVFFVQSGSVNIRIVVMNNLLPSSIRYHEKYDLKGSTYKRRAGPHELTKKSPTFKDLDFMEKHVEVSISSCLSVCLSLPLSFSLSSFLSLPPPSLCSLPPSLYLSLSLLCVLHEHVCTQVVQRLRVVHALLLCI